MSLKKYPFEDFVRLEHAIAPFGVITSKAARDWLASGKYKHGIKRGKYWLVHPEQFKQWWIDGGPGS